MAGVWKIRCEFTSIRFSQPAKLPLLFLPLPRREADRLLFAKSLIRQFSGGVSMGLSYRAVRLSLLVIALSSFVNPVARPHAAESKKLYVYISGDMEGVSELSATDRLLS